MSTTPAGSRITIDARPASQGRVPVPPPGHAVIFTRYDKERSVVLNPADFHRLAELDDALSAIEPIIPSEAALRSHQLEDTPGSPIEDAGQIDEILGL